MLMRGSGLRRREWREQDCRGTSNGEKTNVYFSLISRICVCVRARMHVQCAHTSVVRLGEWVSVCIHVCVCMCIHDMKAEGGIFLGKKGTSGCREGDKW